MIRTIAAVFLLAAGIMTVACGDPEAQSQQAAPTNTPDSSYTPTGETTRARVPPPTEPAASTPVAVTPVPAAGVRDDCPQGWAVADEDGFSFCFPPNDLLATRGTVSGSVAYQLVSQDVHYPERSNRLLLTIATADDPQFVEDADCGIVSGIPQVEDAYRATVDTGFGPVEFCYAAGVNTLGQPHVDTRVLIGDVKINGRFISINASYNGPDFSAGRQMIETILESLEAR